MRMIVRFAKQARVKYLSHLDLQRFMQRALRRSGLPVKYSGGFNPHIAMSFASATKVGYTSAYEVLDVKLLEPIDAYIAAKAMADALPVDMPVMEVKIIPDAIPALMPTVIASAYDITISGSQAWDTAARAFMSEETVIEMRKTKSGEKLSDIRPMAFSVSVDDGGMIRATLALSEKATLKPELLIASIARRIDVEIPEISVHRRQLLGIKRGELTPLMELLP